MAEHSGKDVLSSDVEIKGSIKFQKELLIDGKVEGEINSDGVLTIGENADIQGEIKTKSITVYGKVRGNITVGERCELKSRCTLQGDLKAARLVIEAGGAAPRQRGAGRDAFIRSIPLPKAGRFLEQAPQLRHRMFRLQSETGDQFRGHLDDLPEVQHAHRSARL